MIIGAAVAALALGAAIVAIVVGGGTNERGGDVKASDTARARACAPVVDRVRLQQLSETVTDAIHGEPNRAPAGAPAALKGLTDAADAAVGSLRTALIDARQALGELFEKGPSDAIVERAAASLEALGRTASGPCDVPS